MNVKLISLYIALCVIWGTTWFFIKISLAGTPPFLGVGLRFLIAGLILWVVVFLKKDYPSLDKISLRVYFFFGTFNLAISYAISYWATQFIYSNLSSIIWAGFPLIVSLMTHFILPEERLNRRKIISIILGMSGVILILVDSGSLGGENVTLGIGAVAIAVIIAAGPSIYLKKHHHQIRTIPLNAFSQTSAGIVLLIISALTERGQSLATDWLNLFSLGYLIVFGSVAAWLIYVWLFSHISVTLISYIAFFPPVIATIIGWSVLGERLTPIMIIGAVMVLAGVAIINLRQKSPARVL